MSEKNSISIAAYNAGYFAYESLYSQNPDAIPDDPRTIVPYAEKTDECFMWILGWLECKALIASFFKEI